jgi:hypothetical protein
MSFYDRPEADPLNGPRRLVFEVPRLGFYGVSAEEHQPPVLEPDEETIAGLEPLRSDRTITIPRLGIRAVVEAADQEDRAE